MNNSFIIATYNKAEWLHIVLHSFQQLKTKEEYEIVIVNDGSSDHTELVVSQFKNKLNINYVYQENRGLASARNRAIEAAKGDILLFIDDDRMLPYDFLDEHLKVHVMLNDPKLIVIGERLQLYVSNLELKSEEIIKDLNQDMKFYKRLSRSDDYHKAIKRMFNNAPSNYEIQWIAAVFSNLSVRKSVINEIGGFDPNFKGWGCEDIELGYRLCQNGSSIYLNENAKNYHLEHPRSSEIPKQFMDNFTYMYNKHNRCYAMELYLEFEQGRLSLEDYNLSVKNDKLTHSPTGEQTYFKDTNVFRVKGMN
ncbi:glycosyltransferase [Paenibacillus sp. FSL K6-1096]|uniref:glycosyltransferase family 2 protein n=1 Tax=Paenibacillus sp. FSL K6-1096 TaxID=2921460 RepID=UPI0030EB402F